MDAVSVIRRLHQHRNWVNEKLLAACESLTEEQLRQPFAIGQGSVWQSLLHLYAAEYVWLETLLGDEQPLVPGDLPGKLPGNQLGDATIRSFADLCEEWRKLATRWQQYLSQLSTESLSDWVYKTSTSSGYGQRSATKRSDILLHLCTHSQYTVAQVVNMLRQLGIQPLPDVMLISLARQETVGK